MTLDRTVGIVLVYFLLEFRSTDFLEACIGNLRFLIGTQNIHVLLESRKYLTRSLKPVFH